jgi:hypothetical protein
MRTRIGLARRAAAGCLAVLGLLTGCSNAAADHGPFGSQAVRVVADLGANNPGAAERTFDAALRAALPTPALAHAWAGFQHQFGAYRGHGTAEFAKVGRFDVEQVPVRMARASGVVRVTYTHAGAVAGLYFLKPGTALP